MPAAFGHYQKGGGGMADTPEPGAALPGGPAAVGSGHDRGAPAGCVAPGHDQTAAQPAQGVTGAGQARVYSQSCISFHDATALSSLRKLLRSLFAWRRGTYRL
jgi:hypothetical protein